MRIPYASQNFLNPQKVSISIASFFLLILLVLLVWNAWERFSDYKHTQISAMQKSSWAAASEVANYIQFLQSSVKMFAENESAQLENAKSSNAIHSPAQALLNSKIKSNYPDSINYLIWDHSGKLITDAEGTQLDKPEVYQLPSIGNSNSEFAVRMFHNSEQEHFNIIVPWVGQDNMTNLFGISFPSELVQPLLYKHQSADFQLVLWRHNTPGYVEYLTTESELDLINDVYLDEDDMQRVGAVAVVGGTEWDVVSLHQPDLFIEIRNQILLSNLSKFLLVLVIVFAAFKLYKAEITRRFKANEELHKNEERLKLALESTQDGVWEIDYDNQECFFDNRWCKLFGYSNLEFQNVSNIWDTLIHKNDLDKTKISYDAIINGESEYYSREHRIKCKSGKYKWAYDRGQVLEWHADGTPARVIGTTADITKRKSAELALRNSEEALHSFYSIVSVEGASLHNQIQCLLATGCQHLRMKCGILSYIEGDRYTVMQVHTSSPEYSIQEGDKFDLGITYCQFTLQQCNPVGFAHAKVTDLSSHPAYKALKLEAYLGVPVFLDSKPYGTLNFTSVEPRENEFTESEKYFVQLMAEWISNKLQSQQAIQREKEASKTLAVHLETSPTATIEWDQEGKIQRWSKRAEEILGLHAEKVLGLKPSEWPVLHPRQRDSLNKLHKKFSKKLLEVSKYSCEIVDQDGNTRYTEWIVTPVKHLFNNNVYYLANIQDVTERVNIQQELVRSQARFHDLYENAPDMYLSIDANGIIKSLNQYCAESLGYSKDEILNKPYWNMIHEQDLRRVRRHINVVFQDRVSDFEMESRVLTKGGDVINTHQRLRLVDAQRGIPRELRILCRDVTQRATSQQQRLDHIKVQRDELGREIRHRIKNNLQAIVGLLKVNLDTYPELRNVLVTSINQVDTISIVNGLMIDAEHKLVNLIELVKRITQASSRLFSQDIHFEVETEELKILELWEEETVAVSLIISELITNALKHMSALRPGLENVQVLIKHRGSNIVIHVINPVSELANLDFEDQENSNEDGGVGMSMVQSLMPPKGAELKYCQKEQYVHTKLVLSNPVIVNMFDIQIDVLKAI